MRVVADPQRRQFLRTGLGVSLSLWVASSLPLLSGCSTPLAAGRRWLRQQDVDLLERFTPLVISDAVAADIPDFIGALEDFYLSTAPATRRQIRQIFDLMSLAPTRRWLTACPDFDTAALPRQRAALHAMQHSDSDLRVAVAGFFIQSLAMVWYERPQSWAAIGYEHPAHLATPIIPQRDVPA